jgi:Flp pilus assembly pilin Flp
LNGSEGTRRGVPAPSLDFTAQHRGPPDDAKGGELVLKLFAFTQALVANATDALRRDEGQTMAEYGVVLAVMTLVVFAALTLLSENVRSALENVANIL